MGSGASKERRSSVSSSRRGSKVDGDAKSGKQVQAQTLDKDNEIEKSNNLEKADSNGSVNESGDDTIGAEKTDSNGKLDEEQEADDTPRATYSPTATPGNPITVPSSSKPSPVISPVSPTVKDDELSKSVAPGGEASGKFDIEDVIARLLAARYAKPGKSICLKNSEIMQVCYRAREVFLGQSCLLELNPPVNIVGDIHGQYDDLLRIFDIMGYPPQTNYLFLGDYVDRGKQSLETILLLLCYKIKYPENFFILRGNHECASVNRVYGFYDECKRRCNLKIWKIFTDVFNCLPIAAVVAGKIFCVHGGLSPSLNIMDDIRMLQRPSDVPDFGLLNDLLWSDPSETAAEWEDNERGVSYCFGKTVLNEFLNKQEFDLVARAHMVVEDGYEFFNDRTLVTIFSAPNYCGEFDNKGAIMSVNDELLCSFEIVQPQIGGRFKKRNSSPPQSGQPKK